MKQQKHIMATKALACSALLAAMSIVLARFLSYAPFGSVRWSLDKFPLFLSGLFFGPLAGAMTGFVADAAGSMLQYGFNPILCPPAVMFGLFGGLLRHFVAQKDTNPLRLAVSYLLPVVLGAILYQSAALAWCFNPATFQAAFMTNLWSRTIQFCIIAPLEIAIMFLLIRTGIFRRMGVWPPIKKKRGTENDC